MSSFAVFGVTKTACKAAAEKKTPKVIKGRVLTATEYAEKRDEIANELYEKRKPAKCSGMFDAPQFAMDFIKAAGDNGKNFSIKVRVQKCDKEGKPLLKRGKPVFQWQKYEAS